MGDKLFGSQSSKDNKLRKELAQMDPELVRQVIEKDSPEFIALLEEYQHSAGVIEN